MVQLQKKREYSEEELIGEILFESYQLFGLYGIRRVRMQDIAREAGISRTTLYKYFSSKREIVMRLLGAMRLRATALMNELDNETLSFETKLTMITESKLAALQEMGEIFIKEILADEEYRVALTEIQAEISRSFVEFLKREQKQGNICGEYDAEFLSMYFMSLQKLIEDEKLAEFYPDMADFTVALINIALRGIWTRHKE
ncbi:MAG: TetR/AcrR family transcriptional regulator; helix-turn-helix transcriptional regulator [Candidatus Cloacimonetes bacterium]|nr:TetR/AcrR family transcriptional regulator; helix-turn-helix transcriptional regulator [Candidatus Cloacimonadota bacterium]